MASALFDGLGIILGYIDTGYYIYLYNKQNWQLISLITILAYLYQTYVMSTEYKKKIPYMIYHLYFWIILAFNSIAALVFGILLVFQAGDKGSIFNWSQAIIVLGLIIIQIGLFVLKRHDVYSLQGLPFFTNGLVNIIPAADIGQDNLRQSMLKQSFLASNLLKIEVKKAIIKENEQLVQLNIIYQEQVIKTQKTKYDFQFFEQQLRKFMDQNPELYQAFNESKLPNFSEYFDDDWARIIILLQPIFKTLQRRVEFYQDFLYQFLDLPQNLINQIKQVLKEDNQEQLMMDTENNSRHIYTEVYTAPKYNTQKNDLQVQNNTSKTEFKSPLKKKDKQLSRGDMKYNNLESINDVEDGEQDEIVQDYQNKKKNGKKKKNKQISFVEPQQLNRNTNAQKQKSISNENKSLFVTSTNEIQPRNGSIESYESEISGQNNNDDKQNQGDSGNKKNRFNNNNQQFTSLYFNVSIKDFVSIHDHFEYIISVNYADNPKKIWKVQKRYNDFEDLNKNLKKVLKGELPKLPGKKILMEEKRDFKKFKAKKINTETKIDNNESYVVYRFQILCEGQKVKILEKRYRQFDDLNDSLKIRYTNHKQQKPELYKDIQFPEFPPKLSAFGFKTSTKHREEKLVEYLNALFQLPEIGQSYVFINFVQIPLQQQQNRSKKVSKEDNNLKLLNNKPKTSSEEIKNNKSAERYYQEDYDYGDLVDSYKIDNLGPRFVKESQEEVNFFS
ncbi:Phox homologous domain [Pseudocohnilembus persalinus]|uniref:Phox homologous domain n=1 Tax=Pseudocohnilembus persalinus TaxID=266149 RepID=A0A0V0QTM8_PSEPJ|nr:Phox homologous domain [Pseudocohnilembus persalinus]|eukprot:KRX05547.1 Phox homologous domain [Pseudocohnilembus persalinus]